MSNKLYISNMCQAGFLHKNTQTIPYQHPFIFCCFMEKDFVKFVEDFDDTNFSNYKNFTTANQKFIIIKTFIHGMV